MGAKHTTMLMDIAIMLRNLQHNTGGFERTRFCKGNRLSV